MSKFPITGLSSNGNRVIEKTKIDNDLYFENLGAIGPNWGEAFVSPMNMAFSDGANAYKLHYHYIGEYVYKHEVATNGTDFFLAGTSAVRPSKYNIATGAWSEGSYAYNDLGSLSVSVGAFNNGTDMYFYTNNPDMGTDVNFFSIYKFNPTANTWTNLASDMSTVLAHSQNVIYGFLGVAGGYAYFMMMVKSSTASYAPAGFPTVMRYNLSAQTWHNTGVTPPLVDASGSAWTSTTAFDTMFRGNNVFSCKYSDTEFLVLRKGYEPKQIYTYAVWNYMNTNEVYRYDTVAGTFTLLFRFKDDFGEGYVPNSLGSNNYNSQDTGSFMLGAGFHDSRIFYKDGIVYVWKSMIAGLMAYEISSQKQFFVPIRSLVKLCPFVCETGGKIHFFGGYREAFMNYSNGVATLAFVPSSTGVIIDIGALSAFLTKEKTIAVNARSFD